MSFALVEPYLRKLESYGGVFSSLDTWVATLGVDKEALETVLASWAQISLSDFETVFTHGFVQNQLVHENKPPSSPTIPPGLTMTREEFARWVQEQRIQYQRVATPFGKVLVLESAKGIVSISYEVNAIDSWKKRFKSTRFIEELGVETKKLHRYFIASDRVQERPKVLMVGTAFQIQVWNELLSTDTGQLVTYKSIAQRIQNPKALRAVGTAVGQTPIAYLIPCHRIVNTNGKMGKYRWGSVLKKAMNLYEYSQQQRINIGISAI